MFNFIGSILAKTGAVISGVFISIGAFFGGIPPAQEIVPIAPAEEAMIATATTTAESSDSENRESLAPRNKEVIPVPVTNGNQMLLIEKCKAENAIWLATWPALEQSIRDKVRNDYQSALLSYAQQYKGIITAGDIASSTSASGTRIEQQAVSDAKTKFDLAGSEAYQKCLSTIQN